MKRINPPLFIILFVKHDKFTHRYYGYLNYCIFMKVKGWGKIRVNAVV